jgi:hypothetical protein
VVGPFVLFAFNGLLGHAQNQKHIVERRADSDFVLEDVTGRGTLEADFMKLALPDKETDIVRIVCEVHVGEFVFRESLAAPDVSVRFAEDADDVVKCCRIHLENLSDFGIHIRSGVCLRGRCE